MAHITECSSRKWPNFVSSVSVYFVIWCQMTLLVRRIEIIDQKVPGQKDIFAPVLSGVPGKWPVAPVGSAPMQLLHILLTNSKTTTTTLSATKNATKMFIYSYNYSYVVSSVHWKRRYIDKRRGVGLHSWQYSNSFWLSCQRADGCKLRKLCFHILSNLHKIIPLIVR